jgi:hypothetical protein
MVLVGDEKKDDKALNVILGAARIPQAALMLTPGDCVVMKMACPVALLLLITVAIAAPTSPASAAGCASGAAAGAVAGHFVGWGTPFLGPWRDAPWVSMRSTSRSEPTRRSPQVGTTIRNSPSPASEAGRAEGRYQVCGGGQWRPLVRPI